MKKRFVIENLEITGISAEGRAVGRDNGMVIFVDGAVPGDIIDAEIYRKKKNFAEGALHRLVTPSTQRVIPVCIHFGVCGGCKWQHLAYSSQLAFKEKQVTDAFSRIGHIAVEDARPILGNAQQYFYRNKLEFTFSDKKWLTTEQLQQSELEFDRRALGFHIPGKFDKILDIEQCHLQPGDSNAIRNAVRKYAIENSLSFFDIRQQKGFLRTLMIRTTTTGQTMVLVAVFEWMEKELFGLLRFLEAEFPALTTIVYTHNPKKNDSMDGLEIIPFKGEGFITEVMEGLSFRISAKSFYQTNPVQAQRLYEVTRSLAGLNGSETVYDLYTGTGTIANFISRSAKKVIGVEYVEDAVADARINSALNNISNTVFYSGDMKDVLVPSFAEAHGRPDVIITDPPRAGMHEDVVRAILQMEPEKIVYVSCNPSTQARDIALMQEHYHVTVIQPVDMFPQTSHVENVALLIRR